MDFAAGVYTSEAQNPKPHPLHSVYVYTSILIHTEKGGGRADPREGERGNTGEFTDPKAGLKIPT